MKRSEINNIIKDACLFFDEMKFVLPPWAKWSLSQWKENQSSCAEIIDNMLGWDITDFGSGDFYKEGLFLFTLRNGQKGKYAKPYAEKIMIAEEEQVTPMHFHWNKMEDIINRGGGELVIELFKADEDEGLSPEEFEVSIDGIRKKVKGGDFVTLLPGESICLEQYVYHKFYSAKGKGKVMIGEVSLVNDDSKDNRFYTEVGRFPIIEEDETILYPLASDYKNIFK